VTRNNAQSKVTEVKKAAPGSLVRQSVSVIVDSKATGIDLNTLEQAVSSAAGIDAKRGDSLSVTSLPFDQTAAKTAAAELKKAEAVQQRQQLIGYGKHAAALLGGIALLFMVWMSVRKRRKVSGTDELLQLDLLEARATAPADQRQALEAADRAAALEGGAPGPAMPQRRKDDVLALVERQPDEVAELLRGWLADRRG
jgi:flagellar M-ring protein FliF